MKKSKPEKKKPAKGAGKAPAKKAAAKAAPKKAAPVKKAAAKAVPKKAAPASRRHEAAKQTNQAVAKKPAKAPVKAAPKKVVKAAAKAAVKTAPKKEPKAVAKTATKAAPAKAAPAPAKKEEPKAKVAPAPVKDVSRRHEAAKPLNQETPAPKAKSEKADKAEKAGKAAAPVEAFPALDPSIKRPAKPFFLEVKPGVERVIKRGDKSAATQGLDIQARRKGPAAEESAEELAERIERELQSQSFLKRNRMRPQMCTKCGINAVSPRFTIDRELGYCDSCAEILRLGETKEARRMEFNLALKKEEGEEGGGEEEPSPEDVEDVPDED